MEVAQFNMSLCVVVVFIHMRLSMCSPVVTDVAVFVNLNMLAAVSVVAVLVVVGADSGGGSGSGSGIGAAVIVVLQFPVPCFSITDGRERMFSPLHGHGSLGEPQRHRRCRGRQPSGQHVLTFVLFVKVVGVPLWAEHVLAC